jgi:hypothetical protein
MTPMLCKIFGHNYSYYWICKRCGDHAGSHLVGEIVRAAVQEAKKEVLTARETGAE